MFKISRVLFDDTIAENDRLEWLDEHRLKPTYYKTKGLLLQNGFVEYQQMQITHEMTEESILVEPGIYVKIIKENPRIKIKQQRPTRLGIDFKKRSLKNKQMI